MSDGKGQRKFPIPEGFAWNHARFAYMNEDGHTWDSDTNLIHRADEPVHGKFPIPGGFVWSHNTDTYVHPDGRHWNSTTNEFWDPRTREYRNAFTPHESVKETVEQEIQRKGLVAPRVTPADIENSIAKEEFQVFANSTLTVCVLTLKNGFTVTGESACASPENFDEALGRRISRDNAKAKIWPLLGYSLRDRLHQGA